MTTSSHRPANQNAARASRRDIETLEHRQLFSGVAASEHVFFPSPQAFAQFVAIERALSINAESINAVAIDAVSIEFGTARHFGPPVNGNARSANTAANGSAVGPAAARDLAATMTAVNGATAAPRTVVAAADSLPTQPADTAVTAVLHTGDSNNAPAAIEVSPVASGATPAPTAAAAAVAGLRVFSDRPVTFASATLAAAPAPQAGVGLVNLLAVDVPAARTIAPSAPIATHRASTPTRSDSADDSLPAERAETPSTVTLATLPTGNLMAQSLWQRLAAASVTIILLTANWVLRRNRDSVNAVARRRA